jgi:rRNA maturation endonuclease Nob1
MSSNDTEQRSKSPPPKYGCEGCYETFSTPDPPEKCDLCGDNSIVRLLPLDWSWECSGCSESGSGTYPYECPTCGAEVVAYQPSKE